MPVPTGNDTAAAHAFYNYLWAQYFAAIPPQRTVIMWSGPFYVALFFIILSIFFYVYVKDGLHVHRKKGEMYGIMSFAGSILERIGPLSAFDWYINIVIILWALFYIVTQILNGYVYINPVR